ncbi:RTA1 like protein-domain-containing protein [Roridomyces roridus]|uniref:RTA1 like protein-domain-containing protein n=1 Tax=Roridomyces roridus TaxID=1738132 RepID=A0AAD7C7M6_9AGAR|nr:RTA1 like protein-domain-containing protein [Roridomyces roridus]
MVHVQCLDPHDDSYNFLYCPSFPAAVIFTCLFGLTTLTHFAQAIYYRKKFCWVVTMAGGWEFGGFILRVFSILHTTSSAYATPSQILILLAPLWVNAFLYVLVARLVWFFVPEQRVAGIGARRMSLIFVLLDVTAFLMQAGGGSMISSDDGKTALLGIHIYMGGIGLQQLFILGFTGLVVRFHYKMRLLDSGDAWKTPLYLVYASLSLITVRIIYRLIEFSSGLYSPLTMHEAPLYTLEALPMFAALVVWNLYHPGRVLVGEESEFPKKEKKAKKDRKSKRDVESCNSEKTRG